MKFKKKIDGKFVSNRVHCDEVFINSESLSTHFGQEKKKGKLRLRGILQLPRFVRFQSPNRTRSKKALEIFTDDVRKY